MTTFMVELNDNICLPHEKRVDFYHKMKLPVFVIKVIHQQSYTYGGGMGVTGDGIVLTSAQVIGNNFTEISLRSYAETEFTTAELLYSDRNQDLALLRKCHKVTTKTGAEPPDVFPHVEFCPAECIKVGMQVFFISHSWTIGYTLTIGEIAYPASTEEDLYPGQTCFERSINWRQIKDCTFMTESRNLSWKNLKPDLRVIQVNNIHGGDGSNGSPVFNASGRVIGMRIFGHEGFDFCVHVDTL